MFCNVSTLFFLDDRRYDIRTKRLLVNKRRSKVEDNSRQGNKTEEWEVVSSEIGDTGCNHVGSSNRVGENVNVDHVGTGVPGDECGSGCCCRGDEKKEDEKLER